MDCPNPIPDVTFDITVSIKLPQIAELILALHAFATLITSSRPDSSFMAEHLNNLYRLRNAELNCHLPPELRLTTQHPLLHYPNG